MSPRTKRVLAKVPKESESKLLNRPNIKYTGTPRRTRSGKYVCPATPTGSRTRRQTGSRNTEGESSTATSHRVDRLVGSVKPGRTPRGQGRNRSATKSGILKGQRTEVESKIEGKVGKRKSVTFEEQPKAGTSRTPPTRIKRKKVESSSSDDSEDKSENDEDEDEESLQEMRIQEELLRLSDIKEIVRDDAQASDQCEQASDVEDLNGDNGIGLGDVTVDSDNELDLDLDSEQVNQSNPKCPPPAPRKGRGGRHFVLRKKMDEDLSRGDVQDMCDLIMNSIRKSLSVPNLEIPQPSESRELEQSAGTSTGSGSDLIVYKNFRKSVSAQEQWLNDKTSAFASDPKEFLASTCARNFLENNLLQQLYHEHLSWIVIEAKTDEDIETVPIEKDGHLAWFPSFKKRYAKRYQILSDKSPESEDELNLALSIALEKVHMRFSDLLMSLHMSHNALLKIYQLVRTVAQDKRKICDAYEHVHDILNFRDPKFDEASIYGLKLIKQILEPPYFKTEDGILAAPATPDAIICQREIGSCFLKRGKQKWTTKDLKQLKSCIVEVLQTKKYNTIKDRYETLMIDCITNYQNEIAKEGLHDVPALEPFRRRRGRPKKSELELSAKYGKIYPVVAVLENGTVIRAEMNPHLLGEWRKAEEEKIQRKTYEELVNDAQEKIEWTAVSKKMIIKSRKNRVAEDCELAWCHQLHPNVNNKRWGVKETKLLKEIYAEVGNDWTKLAALHRERSGQASGRTPYQCFFRVRNHLAPPKKLEWNPELDNLVLEKLRENSGNWRLVAASLGNPAATKDEVIERYKKSINPVLRNGTFTRVEDCLLILTIEKLKPFLAREGHFGSLLAYLPWRYETAWRERANALFSDWIVPWTLEEDKMLLRLAKTMNRDWQKISEEFTSFKNRKGCLSRYKILKKKLMDPRFKGSLEAYHEAYAMTRYNVIQCRHLKEILTLLIRVQKVELAEEYRRFPGLLRDRAPSEVRLQHMLLCFDRNFLNSAIVSLSRYVKSRDDYWQAWIDTHGQKKKTFDRRTFNPENPQSVASAIHIRGLKLKPKAAVSNMTDFENEIYKFFGRYCRTKGVNRKAKRPYIPDGKTLAQWSAVSRIIATPLDKIKEEKSIKKKWKPLDLECDEDKISDPVNEKVVASSSRRATTSKGPKVEKQTKRGGRRKTTELPENAEEKRLKLADNATSDADGYLLIPPDLEKPKRKVGKPKRKSKEESK